MPSGSTAAELWDPQTLSFSSAGTHAGIAEQTATLLPDGRVLIGDGATFELWDPVDLSFQPAGRLLLDIANYTATGLPDGRVLIVGGFAGCGGSRARSLRSGIHVPSPSARRDRSPRRAGTTPRHCWRTAEC